ncbi:hypothetical protein P691DRAFT_777289 [Macrolepiota fuliginosa MF-IS2]|uniref:Mid2 domain-containing protein n=1 Tax=Macrolepiota fuliginosa MF-IS2 TaxID=1400762 RepID=A0A9P5XA19_9AGAR|nr:hypothetical protein P691DRAFT_777289 [Macrolepiota fuliginosa MF-IS2]
MYHHVLFLLVVHYIVGAVAQTNTTVDDSDTIKIQYTGSWNIQVPSSPNLDVGGNHHLADADTDGQQANFTFTGIAVYFMSPLWPYFVSTQLQLDSGSLIHLNLTNPNGGTGGSENVQSAVVWGSGPLPNGVHTLLVSKIPGDSFAVVDAIIYTVQDPPAAIIPQSTAEATPSSTTSSTTSSTASTTSSTVSTSSSAASTTSSTVSTSSSTTATTTPSTTQGPVASATSSASSSKRVVAIAVGAVLGSLALLFIIPAAAWFFRRKKRLASEDWTIARNPPETSSPLGPLSPQEVQPTYLQHPYGSSPKASWTGSTPQMSTINAPMGTNTQPYEYHQISNQPTQEFDPYAALVPTPVTTQHPSAQRSLQSSGHYAPTTLSTITDQSTPGTLGSNKTPLLASSAPFPSADPSYYAPEKPTGKGTHLSYTSDMSAGAPVAATYQRQHPVFPGGSAGQLRSPVSSNSINDARSKPGKLESENESMIVINRIEDEPEGSSPPAYTPN